MNNHSEINSQDLINALERGEAIDFLYNSLKEKYYRILHDIIDELLKEETDRNSEIEKLQSIMSLIYTLLIENRIEEIDNALRQGFPEYYY